MAVSGYEVDAVYDDGQHKSWGRDCLADFLCAKVIVANSSETDVEVLDSLSGDSGKLGTGTGIHCDYTSQKVFL
jgi:hypothetical protein